MITSKAHPWHGIDVGRDAPALVCCFIEIVPTDTVNYEIDKESGYLKIDRLQKYSNQCPMLYGFIPKTYCGTLVGQFCSSKVNSSIDIQGDGDPLDVCVLTEKIIPRGDIILQAIPIGGLRMIDDNEADDKIIAVLKDDAVYGAIKDVSMLPNSLVDRLKHYFLTYKQLPGDSPGAVEIVSTYARDEAHEVIRAALSDYSELVKG